MQPIPPPLVAVLRACWKPPLVNFVKINVDGAVSPMKTNLALG